MKIKHKEKEFIVRTGLNVGALWALQEVYIH